MRRKKILKITMNNQNDPKQMHVELKNPGPDDTVNSFLFFYKLF